MGDKTIVTTKDPTRTKKLPSRVDFFENIYLGCSQVVAHLFSFTEHFRSLGSSLFSSGYFSRKLSFFWISKESIGLTGGVFIFCR